MVCTSLGSLLRPLFYFLCYIHFSLTVVRGISKHFLEVEEEKEEEPIA